MRRASGLKTGTTALVAVLALAFMAFFAAGLGAGAASHATTSHAVGPTFSGAAPASMARPAVANLSNLSVAVAFTSTFSNYQQLPYNLSFTITVLNGTWGAPNAGAGTGGWIGVQIRDVATICQGALGAFGTQCPGVVNISLNDTVTSSTTYTTEITTNDLLAPAFRYNCPAGGAPCTYGNGILPNDQYQLFVWATYNNSVANVTSSAEQALYLITTNPSATLLAPLPGSTVSTGNVSVGITYAGSYVTGASVTIYSGTTATAANEVYFASLFAPGAGIQTVIASTAWVASTAGTYFAQVNITTPYGTTLFGNTLTVSSAGGGIVYQNTTTSGGGSGKIFGMSAQVGGTILLVVGLIVGMIVAMLLGRMMWSGGSASSSPAQPWQSKSTNECSVCHQSFATEAELKDHQKSAHGMS